MSVSIGMFWKVECQSRHQGPTAGTAASVR